MANVLYQPLSLAPEDVTDDEWNQEAVRIVLVIPPIATKLQQHRRIEKSESKGDYERFVKATPDDGTHLGFSR